MVVGSAFLGRPDFQSRGPQTLDFEGFRSDLGQKSGAPQTQIQGPPIQRPILGPLSKGACAVTTKVLSTIKFAPSKLYCRGVSHETKRFWTIFLSTLTAHPPQSANFIFIVVSPSLKARETPKKTRVFLLAELTKIFGKERKNASKKQGKSENPPKKQGNRKTKKARIGGSGSFFSLVCDPDP